MLVRFGTESYRHRSARVSRQQMVNCYLETPPKANDKPPPVVSSFGIEEFATPGTAIRGGTTIDGIPYVVSGTGLYRIGSTGVATLLGTVTGAGPVDVMGEVENVLVTNSSAGWIYDGATVTQISDPDFPGADRAQYLDGYAVVIKDGEVWINETSHDFQVWNALDFATPEAAPDTLLDEIVSNRLIYLGGVESIEIWENTGNADFPLERAAGGTVQMGIACARAFAKQSNRVFFYAIDGTISELQGTQAVPISTPAVAQAIEGYTDKSCTTMAWTESSHPMVAWSFAQGTWVYDLSTQLWHERKSTDHTRWRPFFALRAYGETFVADYSSNKLGKLSPNVFTEWGEVLRAYCVSPSVRGPHSKLQLTFQSGVGLITGQGSDPQIMLHWSDDGGSNFGPEVWMPLGAIGQYRTLAGWSRLAAVNEDASRDRVYAFAISDPVRRTLVEANAL